jgi:hypothetical protein
MEIHQLFVYNWFDKRLPYFPGKDFVLHSFTANASNKCAGIRARVKE